MLINTAYFVINNANVDYRIGYLWFIHDTQRDTQIYSLTFRPTYYC